MPLLINYQLSSNTGLRGEPVRGNAWILSLSGVDNFDELGLYCKSFTMPAYSSSPVEINHFNEKTKIAGAIDLAAVSVEINDILEPNLVEALYWWWTKIYDPITGEVGYASEYKKDGYISQFDSRGKPVRAYNLYGLWPTGFNPGSLDYTSFDPIPVSMELSCDRAVLVGPKGSADTKTNLHVVD